MDVVLILAILGVLVTLFVFLNRKKPEPIKTGRVALPNDDAIWTVHEIGILNDLYTFRRLNNLGNINVSNELKKLSQERVEFWKANNYTKEDNLHNYFLGIAEEYKERGIFIKMGENANLNYNNDFEAFFKSTSHRNNMANNWRYVGITDRHGYCCMIFAI